MGGCCFLLTLFVVLSVTQARRSDRPRYRTAYSCEGSQLSMECEDGHLIHLIRANYGRFSISICNDHGNLDWSVDCMSRLSFRVMQESCGMKKGCSLPASSAVFGDPCPGTLKYLEAHYQCVPEGSTTTRRPHPPVLYPPVLPSPLPPPPTPPNFHPPPINISFSTTTTSTTTMATLRPNAASTYLSTGGSKPQHAVERGDQTEKVPTDEEREAEVTVPSVQRPSQTTVDLSSSHCRPMYSRNVFWNWTRAGDTAIQRCPGGARGEARWHCSRQSSRWYPNRPDLGGCNSPWIERLEDQLQRGRPVFNIASEFASVTKIKPLFGGDIVQAMGIIQRMISKMEDRVTEFPDDNLRFQVVKDLVQSVVDISSNLLDEAHAEAWQDLSDVEQREAASTLLHGLERNVRLLADTQNRPSQFSHSQKNILVTMKVMKAASVTDMRLPLPEHIAGTDWERMEESVILPAQVLLETSRNGLVKSVFLAYNTLDEILSPTDPPTIYHSSSNEPILQMINSRIVAVSLGRDWTPSLSEPIIIVLKNIQEENVTNPRCVYWEFSRRSWSERGCRVHAANRTHTACACTHLTNFAVLMDIRATMLPFEHEMALRVITYVGCVISIVCLLLTILTFHLFRGLKGDRTTIHKNLCLCLLVAEAVFVGGINQVQLKVLCAVIAGFLHYFFLAAFSWMFLEGFQLYVMLVEVFESEKSRVKWYYALAYGVPAVIVGISAIVDPHSYGSDRYCWLRADNYFIFSFVGPVIAILLANIVFLSIAIYMMCRHANMTVVTKAKEQAKLTSIRMWIRGAMVLVFLLGLTWAFGLLYLSAESVIMAYVFTILNSLQGLFIFVFHCIKNDKVQKEYQKFLQRSDWLPDCLKGDKSQDRRSSFYVHSNGTISGQPSSCQLSSQQHSWPSKDQNKSTNNISPISKGISPETLYSSQQNTSANSTLRKQDSNGKRKCSDSPVQKEPQGVFGGEIKQRANKDVRPHKHHLPPPYGQMTGCNPFLDHIYECIDSDCDVPVYKKRLVMVGGTCTLKNTATVAPPLVAEGHIRTHSDSSRQSSSSCGCDQKPLIPPALPQRNMAAIVDLAQVLNSVPRHSSLPPSSRDVFQRHFPNLECFSSDDYGHATSNSMPDMPQGHEVDNVQPAKCPSDNAVVMAVLDGERVVCRLSPESVQPNTRTHYCHKFSHLSTDC